MIKVAFVFILRANKSWNTVIWLRVQVIRHIMFFVQKGRKDKKVKLFSAAFGTERNCEFSFLLSSLIYIWNDITYLMISLESYCLILMNNSWTAVWRVFKTILVWKQIFMASKGRFPLKRMHRFDRGCLNQIWLVWGHLTSQLADSAEGSRGWIHIGAYYACANWGLTNDNALYIAFCTITFNPCWHKRVAARFMEQSWMNFIELLFLDYTLTLYQLSHRHSGIDLFHALLPLCLRNS